MRTLRIYLSQTLSLHQHVDIVGDSAHHLIKVLRVVPGQKLIVFNGQGGEFEAAISAIQKKSLSIEVINFVDCNREPPILIELGIALIKPDRMDWLIQKATELGISSITPIITEYTDLKINAQRMEKKREHWQKVAQNACQQSMRTRLPTINTHCNLTDWLSNCTHDARWMLDPNGPPFSTEKFRQKATATMPSFCLFVGPEGGITEHEHRIAIENDFLAFSLGPRIMRAETAPLAAITLIQHYFGDFGNIKGETLKI